MTNPLNPPKTWSASTEDQLEAALLEFDENWTPERFEEIAAQLSNAEPKLREAALAGLVGIDLEKHWQQGDCRALEYYFARHPALGTRESVAVDLIFAEYEIRRQFKQPQTFAEFARRFPHQAAALKQMILEARQAGGKSSLLKTGETLKPNDTELSQSGQIKSTPGIAETTAIPKASIPNQFGERYELLKELGAGAMGRVFLARDKKLDRKVALKMPTFSGKNAQEFIERFQQEAKNAARLNHPFLCTIYDFGQFDGKTFITMEYVEGKPLEYFVGKNQFSEARAIRLAVKIAQGLAHAHENGVVHRDVKPDNIMVDGKSNPRIMDFGLAFQSNQDARQTRDGMLLGTPAYMSPEQVRAVAKDVGPLVDVYALGCILYEMLTARLPFGGPMMAVLEQILTTPPENPQSLRADLNPELAAYCLRMMAKKPADRPQSMQEVAKTLQGLLKKLSADNSHSPAQSPEMETHGPKETAALDPALFSFLDDQAVQSPTLITTPAPTRQRQKGFAWPHWIALAIGTLILWGIIITIRHKDGSETKITTSDGDSITIQAEKNSKTPLKAHPPDRDSHSVPKSARPELLVAPFNSDTARERQQAWAKFLGHQDFVETNSLGMKMVLIPPGEFQMGSPEGEKDRLDNELQHQVRITQPFFMGQHEVTRGQFVAFVKETGYKTEAETDGKGGKGWNESSGKFEDPDPKYNWKNVGFPQTDRYPVVNVTWNDAAKFCEWMSKKEGVTYRLPTEAEWEYACRAGTTSIFQPGDDPEGLAAVGNVADGIAKARFADWATIAAADGFLFTAPVGSFRPSALNLYDMHGNVWEWCADCYAADYYGRSASNDPQGPSTVAFRVLRGGAWNNYGRFCRSAYRGWTTHSYRNYDLGFRVVAVAAKPPASSPTFAAEGAGWIDLFNGKDLSGWSNNTHYWKVENGELVSSVAEENLSTQYLQYWEEFGDFELWAVYKLENEGNSGIYFRSELTSGYKIMGPAVDIGRIKRDEVMTGHVREAGTHRSLLTPRGDPAYARAESASKDGWNRVLIRVEGKRITVTINGVQTADIEDPQIAPTGVIALELSSRKKPKIRFSKIQLRKLNTNSTTKQSTTPPRELKPSTKSDSPPKLAGPELLVAPFNSDTARKKQEEWAKFLGHKDFVVTNSLGMKMVLVPPGEFQMGSPPDEKDRQDNELQHRVRITQPFFLGQHEVTHGQYATFVKDTGYRTEAETDGKGGGWNESRGKFERQDPTYDWKNTGFPQTEQHPVVNISWNDASKFCEWMSKKEGQTYRLPTEAQWEYACRAGTRTATQFGDSLSSKQANFIGDSPYHGAAKGPYIRQTTNVGSYQSNAFGLYDMHGNVCEWCADFCSGGYYYQSAVDDPPGPSTASYRVLRGGAWNCYGRYCRSAYRNWTMPTFRLHNLGFRVVATEVNPPKSPPKFDAKQTEWINLFNGKNLEGWMGDTQGYHVKEGLLIAAKNGRGNLYTKEQYANFVFRFEFQLQAGSNNGVGIRCKTSKDAAYEGMEIQILDETSPLYANIKPFQSHGSIFGVVPAKRGFLKPLGEWNSQEITANGSHITVKLNGTVIVDADIEKAGKPKTMDGKEHPGLFNTTGHIGFLGLAPEVTFRNLFLKQLD